MKQTDTQVLNKKLAEWSNLKPIGTYTKQELDEWRYYHAPDFTDSLDDCFKWLVPISPKYNSDVRLIQSITFDYGMCRILDIEGEEYIGESEDAALAFCLAVEKVIDGTS